MSDNMLIKVIRYLSDEANENDLMEIKQWINENQEEFEKIKMVFENIPFEQKEFNYKNRKALVFSKIRNKSEHVKKSRIIRLNYWLKVAAVFTGLFAFGITFYAYNHSLYFEKENLTSQIIEIRLPDNSTVTLDKNAILSYKKDWLNRFTREVNLTGRAYFQVSKMPDHKQFRVNFDDSQIEVLGTKFTVSDNFGNAQVILNEGKVRVTSHKINMTFLLAGKDEQLIITKGGNIRQGFVNSNLYFSWLNDKLNFNNCLISETLEFLSDSYNMDIEMKDKDAVNKHLLGSAPSDNPYLIIEAIAKITNKKVIISQEKITIE